MGGRRGTLLSGFGGRWSEWIGEGVFRGLMDGHDLALQDETTDPYLGGCCVRLRILEYDLRTHDGEIDRPSFLN